MPPTFEDLKIRAQEEKRRIADVMPLADVLMDVNWENLTWSKRTRRPWSARLANWLAGVLHSSKSVACLSELHSEHFRLEFATNIPVFEKVSSDALERRLSADPLSFLRHTVEALEKSDFTKLPGRLLIASADKAVAKTAPFIRQARIDRLEEASKDRVVRDFEAIANSFHAFPGGKLRLARAFCDRILREPNDERRLLIMEKFVVAFADRPDDTIIWVADFMRKDCALGEKSAPLLVN